MNARRPAWTRRAPRVEVDARAAGGEGAVREALLESAEFLRAGQVLLLRTLEEPAGLDRLLSRRGFRRWSGAAGGSGWTVYFLKAA